MGEGVGVGGATALPDNCFIILFLDGFFIVVVGFLGDFFLYGLT